MIKNSQERIESAVDQADMQGAALPEPRLLSEAEIMAVAGGPQTKNNEDL